MADDDTLTSGREEKQEIADEIAEAVSRDGLIASLLPSPSLIPEEPPRRVVLDVAPVAIAKVIGTIAFLWLLIRIFPVLILIVLSLMLVATFNPLVRKLQARWGRSWAIVGVVSVLVLAFLGTFALLIPPLVIQGFKLARNLPLYTQQVQNILAQHHIHFNIQKQVGQLSAGAGSGAPQLAQVFSSVVSAITGFATVAILTIYLLIEGPEVGMSLMRLLPRKDRLPTRRLVREIGNQVGGYMRGQLITSGLAGVASFLVCWIVGVPQAFALGALAAIADAIPIVGLLVALLPAALLALTISPGKAGWVVVGYLIYHQLESHVIGPKVYGNALGLSLSVIVISILIGVELMGMMGALLALPVAAAIPSIVAYIQEWQENHGGSGASETPPLPP